MKTLEDLAIEVLSHGKTTMAQLCKSLSVMSGEYVNTRRGYQTIRNLREMTCPIVGDSSGIWIATTDEEVIEFANRLEHKARRDIASMLHLKNKMMSITHRAHKSVFDSIQLELPLYENVKTPVHS